MKLALIAFWISVSVPTFIFVIRDQEFDPWGTLLLLIMSIGLGGSVVGLVYVILS